MGRGGKGKDKSGGWKHTWQPSWNKSSSPGKGWSNDFMRNAPAEKKVWLGGLPEGSTGVDLNKAVQEHMMQAGSCKYVEVSKSGSGCALFGSAEEALCAVDTLHGSRFRGSILEVDVWLENEYTGQGGGSKKDRQPSAGGWNKKKSSSWRSGDPQNDFMRQTPAARKVWLAGLPEGSRGWDLNKALREHLMEAGSCKYAEVGKSGVGCAIFGSPEEALNAVETLDGSLFQGGVLQVDVWTNK
eukprot:TRINITY_DN2464_c0_g2_i1.p1 TRINITY_DN2464_c0_g2~~TRINITY_DN2464_c0_g2_i1.p1  ORF type:complete len:242 (+),score=50.40 TRINITY_DN2464_c0_g2_i1:89-814(+)